MKQRVVLLINGGIEAVSIFQVGIHGAQHVYRGAHGKGFTILFTRIPETYKGARWVGRLALPLLDRTQWATIPFMQVHMT
jgi:hypothetical protein